MVGWNETKALSDMPDVRLLGSASRLQVVALLIALSIATTILAAWVLPPVADLLPTGWSLMKANTALCILLCVIGLVAGSRNQTSVTQGVTIACGALVAALSATILYGHATGQALWIDTWIAADAQSAMPGRTSISTSLFFLPAGLVMTATSSKTRWRQVLGDLLLTLALAQMLVLLSGYLYDAWMLYQTTAGILTSPHTLIAIVSLSAALIVRHLTHGIYTQAVGMGIGSSFMRMATPWILVLPFLIGSLSLSSIENAWMEIRHAAAITTSASILLVLLFSLFVARKLNHLEAELRSLSLTDPLTGIHNRRGFEVLAGHAFEEATRNRRTVAMLYLDLDGLKGINDRYGHDAGSELIEDFAGLLAKTFRNSDIIGRLGGDEFAVLLTDDDVDACVQRFAQAVAAANRNTGKPYSIQYSLGVEHARPADGDTLADLANRADEAMYRNKLAKRAGVTVIDGDDAAPPRKCSARIA